MMMLAMEHRATFSDYDMAMKNQGFVLLTPPLEGLFISAPSVKKIMFSSEAPFLFLPCLFTIVYSVVTTKILCILFNWRTPKMLDAIFSLGPALAALILLHLAAFIVWIILLIRGSSTSTKTIKQS